MIYVDLERHGDTVFDKNTKAACMIIHVKYVLVDLIACSHGFLGYAKCGRIYYITNMTIEEVGRRFLSSARMVLTEKHRPFYANENAWKFFCKYNGTIGFEYEGNFNTLLV